MKTEILSMDRVTTDDFEMTNLDNMTLRVFKGEIAGLLPVNEQGRKKLLEVLQHNVPLRYGRVRFNGEQVNSYLSSDLSVNRVAVISGASRLVPDLTVCDNLFVLRRGFRKYFLNQKVLDREAKRQLDMAGIDVRPDLAAERLSELERVSIELVKAVMQRAHLIIFDEISSILSMKEIHRLREMMQIYARQGFSFLYIGNHHEEILPLCDRVMVMKNGRIIKNITDIISDEDVLRIAGSEGYPELYFQLKHSSGQEKQAYQAMQTEDAVLEFRDVSSSSLKQVSFCVSPGECIVLLDRSMSLVEETLKILTNSGDGWSGEIICNGHYLTEGTPMRLLDDSIAVISEYPHCSMIFPHLSFLENLSIIADRKISSLFLQRSIRKSICREYAAVFGRDIDAADMRTVSKESKYSLVYYRYCILRPRAVILVRPFSGADMYLRQHILSLMRMLMERGIALVILTDGLTDTYFIADRLLLLEKGRMVCELQKEEFNHLWENLFQNQ